MLKIILLPGWASGAEAPVFLVHFAVHLVESTFQRLRSHSNTHLAHSLCFFELSSFQFSVSFAGDGGMSWTLSCFWESRHSCKLDQTNQVSGFPGCRQLIDFLYKVPLQSTAHTLHHTLSPTDIRLPDHWVQGHLHDLAHQLLPPFLPCFHFYFLYW